MKGNCQIKRAARLSIIFDMLRSECLSFKNDIFDVE